MKKHELQVRQSTEVALHKSSQLISLTSSLLAQGTALSRKVQKSIAEQYPELFEVLVFLRKLNRLGEYTAYLETDWILEFYEKSLDTQCSLYYPTSWFKFSDNKAISQNRELILKYWNELNAYQALSHGLKVDKLLFELLRHEDGDDVFENYYIDSLNLDLGIETLLQYKDRFNYEEHAYVYHAFEWTVEFYEAVKHKNDNMTKYLSDQGRMSFELLRHIEDELDWEELSKNFYMKWTAEIINHFEHKIIAQFLNDRRTHTFLIHCEYSKSTRLFYDKYLIPKNELKLINSTEYSAWYMPELSEEIDWDYVENNPQSCSWRLLSTNETIEWVPRVEKLFELYGHWSILSSNPVIPWNEPDFYDKFKHKVCLNGLSKNNKFHWTRSFILNHFDKEESNSFCGRSNYLSINRLINNETIYSNKELFELVHEISDINYTCDYVKGILNFAGLEGIRSYYEENEVTYFTYEHIARELSKKFPMTEFTLQQATEIFQEVNEHVN